MLGGFFQYAFVNGRLIGSEHPASKGNPRERISQTLKSMGKTAMLTLIERFDRYDLPDLVQYHLPIVSVPTRQQVADAVEIVRSHLDRGECVWVHCQHGIDRTGCVIGAYLCKSGVSADDAVSMIVENFPARRRHPRMLELWRPFEEIIRAFG